MTDPTEALVTRARGGDREALASLWREHRAWVAAVALAFAPRGADVEDLVQDVAAKVIQQIQTLRESHKWRPWLRAITMNTARSAARSERARRATRALRADDDTLADPKNPTARGDASGALERVLALPQEYREPLLLQATRGMTQKQIAEALEIPETTVETRLARARRMLREQNLEHQR
jgi:RNA polymerase sigma-70 factor (ECF subfamily)